MLTFKHILCANRKRRSRESERFEETNGEREWQRERKNSGQGFR